MPATALDVVSVDPDRAFDLYAELRESDDGIHEADGVGTFCFRYDDVVKIFSSPDELSSEIFLPSPQAIHDESDPDQARAVETVSRILLFLDRPAHTRLRSLVKHAFFPRALELWQ